MPIDGAIGSTYWMLNWLPGAGAISNDVYFGTSQTAIADATTESPEYKGPTASTIYVPDLDPLTQYHWRIDTQTTSGTITGTVWTFTTAAQIDSIDSDIITHLTMDTADISGSTIYDVSAAPYYDGTIIDSSGNPTGRIRQVLTLDGINDGATIGAINLNDNNMTISAWIKRNGAQANYTAIVTSCEGSTLAGLTFGLDQELRYNWNNATNTWDWNSGLTVPNGQWSHVALVVESDKATIYLNGVSSTNNVTHAIEQFNSFTSIGCWNGGETPYLFFKGDIDDVAIWKKALSFDEVDYIYQKGLSGVSFDDLPPEFVNDPITGTAAIEGADYAGSISSEASDPDGGAVSFSKIDGPGWLDIASDGTLTGLPDNSDVGDVQFTVRATDDEGDLTQAQLNISVLNTYSGKLGLADLAGFAAHWLETGCVDLPLCGGADLSGNGQVNIEDLRILADNWLEAYAVASCHVESIITGTVNGTSGRKKCQAIVTINDRQGNVVAGATVTGTFEEQLFTEQKPDGLAINAMMLVDTANHLQRPIALPSEQLDEYSDSLDPPSR